MAAENSDEEMVEVLLAAGADVTLVDHNGGTALHSAACVGNVDITRILLDRGLDVNAKDNVSSQTLC